MTTETAKLTPFGLGAMGLHSYLAQQLIEYGSPESVEFYKHLLYAYELTGPWLSQTISHVKWLLPSTTLTNQTMLTEAILISI